MPDACIIIGDEDGYTSVPVVFVGAHILKTEWRDEGNTESSRYTRWYMTQHSKIHRLPGDVGSDPVDPVQHL